MPIIWDKRGKQETYSRESQEDIDKWWDENRNKCWSPQRGLYVPENYEPTDDELKIFEKSLDKPNDVGEACLCSEVVAGPVTSSLKIPDPIIPSANSPIEILGPTRVVPDTVTSTTENENKPCLLIPS